MRIAVLIVTAGIALIVWLKLTRHVQDAPRWKPADRTISDNRSKR